MVAFTTANPRASAERYFGTTTKVDRRFRSGSQVILRPSVGINEGGPLKTGRRQGRDEKGGRRRCKRATESTLLVTKV
jgi:hypothetical protein